MTGHGQSPPVVDHDLLAASFLQTYSIAHATWLCSAIVACMARLSNIFQTRQRPKLKPTSSLMNDPLMKKWKTVQTIHSSSTSNQQLVVQFVRVFLQVSPDSIGVQFMTHTHQKTTKNFNKTVTDWLSSIIKRLSTKMEKLLPPSSLPRTTLDCRHSTLSYETKFVFFFFPNSLKKINK